VKTEPSRQIHLDFHTSEALPDIGSRFSKAQFQEALQTGHVNLINVFAKCHHSWSYYPTKVGRPHPNLKTDLLGQQIEACHEIGVRAPVYYTMGWSAADAEDHPDWCCRTGDGAIVVGTPWPEDVAPDAAKPTFQWKEMCPTGEYHALMEAQVEEICKLYEVDGLWFDIYHAQILCYCDTCRKGMADAGFDATDKDSVRRYRARTIQTHAAALSRIITSYHPEASIYFNGITSIERPENFRFRLHKVNTKNDLEDLPTTWGGYDKFPLRAKIFHREQKPVVAMSGKFHTAWGEFGGFKDPEALRFEAAGMIAYGAGCNFGDHLHPLGEMDMTTYRNIGHAFEYVKRIEEYGLGGTPASTLGFWASFELEADEGLARMLLEEQIDFDLVQSGDDFSRFQTIVVPSHAGLLDSDREQLESFTKAGGSLVILGAGALASSAGSSGGETTLDLGATYLGPAEYDMDYTLLGDFLTAGVGGSPSGVADSGILHRNTFVPQTPFLNYSAANRFELGAGTEELASIQLPYFSRTYGHYCGHQNTPNTPESAAPAAWCAGPGRRIVVAAHALDRLYYLNGAKVHRDFFALLLRLVHTAPMVEAALPSAGRVSLLHQPSENRYVAHLLYGAPIERGRCVVIEDLPELRDVRVRLRVPEHIARLRLEPDGVDLPLAQISTQSDAAGHKQRTSEGWRVVETTIPSFSCHTAVIGEYAG
jgi:hypothetical protein